MRTRALIAAGALAATGLAAGVAQAAPNVTGIEANRVGQGRVEVVVQLDRGTVATPTSVDVTLKGRTRHARALDWAKATSPTGKVNYAAQFRGGRRAYAGSDIDVTVRACDGADCTTTTKTVSVVRTKPIGSRLRHNAALAPLPAGAIDAAGAAKVALASVGTGSSLLEVERADELGAAWEVKVLRTDGARVKVYVAVDGSVVGTRVEAPRAGRRDDHPEDHQPPAPIPGAVTADQAIAAALAFAGDGSVLVGIEAERGPVVAFEVKVQKADGTRWEVKVAPDGTVVKAEIDH